MPYSADKVTAPREMVTLDGHTISYALRRSDRARYARIEISPEAGLTVVIPRRYAAGRVGSLLTTKRKWILETLAKYGLSDRRGPKRALKPGDVLPYLGRNMRMETSVSKDKAGSVIAEGENLVVSMAPGDNRYHLALENWYRQQASDKLSKLAAEAAQDMEISFNRLTVKGQKRLWGSCSRKHNLNFNWRLMMTPEPVVHYVVVHELAHLKEMNHSRRFWAIVEKHCPGWRGHRKWLRDHAQELARVLPA